jgi:hypothetical protein
VRPLGQPVRVKSGILAKPDARGKTDCTRTNNDCDNKFGHTSDALSPQKRKAQFTFYSNATARGRDDMADRAQLRHAFTRGMALPFSVES